MEYRSLGKTGLRVSEIGFGCGNTAGLLTGGGYEEQRQAIQRALELGINYFDTAPNYGERVYERGRSESNLGKLLKELGAHPVLGTKIELHAHDLADIPGAVARSVDESLERLDLANVDLLYLHNRVGAERGGDAGGAGTIGGRLALRDVLGPGGVLEAFERQRSEGKVRFLAFCSSGGDPVANLEIIEHGGFDCVQLSYSILEPTEGRAAPPGYRGEDYGQTIDFAGEHQLGVVVIRVLSGGVLSGAREPHPLNTGSGVERSYAADATRAEALRFMDRPGEHTMAQAAIRYALTKPEVSTVLVGFSSVDHVDEAAAASGRGPLAAADLGQIEELYTTDFKVRE
jgi:aryl-alcohol dehydrogenase-like predicted oxidoreductase